MNETVVVHFKSAFKMSKNKLLLILFLSLVSISAIGQGRNLEDLTVGFMCGISPQTSPLVDQVTHLINDKAYSEISKLLYSKNSGEIFLSILILERLAKNEIYLLNETEVKYINHYKSLSIPVYNCLGCFSEVNSMNELFEKENSIEEITWLNKILPIK